MRGFFFKDFIYSEASLKMNQEYHIQINWLSKYENYNINTRAKQNSRTKSRTLRILI